MNFRAFFLTLFNLFRALFGNPPLGEVAAIQALEFLGFLRISIIFRLFITVSRRILLGFYYASPRILLEKS